ncbi:HEPN domain-containing protein [Streptomyces dioscori]|uniref:HEPN domain-containing protein n=1 Tax=Streptomyces dioscori TaxID=2109333 RepID=UPI00131EC9B7|nr:HEPN domain-containing protein [Streptomyces dioscori]
MIDIEGLLTATYGSDFIRYVLAIPEQEDLNGISGRADQSVLNILTSLALGSINAGSLDASILTASSLSQYIPDEGTSLVQFLRKSSGGDISPENLETDDAVYAALAVVAQDIWPVYLIPPPSNQSSSGFFMSNLAGIAQHPKSKELGQFFMEDPSLSKLFPKNQSAEQENPAPLMESSEWVVNSGYGGTRQIIGVLTGLIYDARLRVQLAGQKLTSKSLISSLKDSLSALRSLAESQPVDVPVIIGLSGVSLSQGQEIQFTDGILRGILPTDGMLLNNVGNCGAVYETTYPLRVLHVFNIEPGGADWAKPFNKYRARIEESLRSFEYSLEKVRLALLLCSDGDDFLAPKEESRLILDPTNMGGTNQRGIGDHTPTNTELPSSKFQDAVATYDVIRKKHPESLNIAMKRILSAASSRRDSNDALIDSLIAWENMFGTRTETTFRVTASLAKVLEADSGKRLDLQKELNKLYGVRSAMVHGAKEPDPDAAARNRQRVISVAINGLRCLYHDRPELLSMPPEDRSKTVLLEG